MSARQRQNKERRKAIAAVPVGLPRDQVAHYAQAAANREAKKLPFGSRVVVVVTDANGEWVGVGSNTHPKDVEAILRSSLLGADKREPKVIEVEAEGEST